MDVVILCQFTRLVFLLSRNDTIEYWFMYRRVYILNIFVKLVFPKKTHFHN